MRATVSAAQEAWRRSDAAALAQSLTRDALLLVDAGGRVAVPVRRATTAGGVASALIALTEALSVTAIAEAEVNGTPGLRLLAGDRVVGVVGFELRGQAISHAWAVVNPAKLAHWNG